MYLAAVNAFQATDPALTAAPVSNAAPITPLNAHNAINLAAMNAFQATESALTKAPVSNALQVAVLVSSSQTLALIAPKDTHSSKMLTHVHYLKKSQRVAFQTVIHV